jgi:hypothetical protein
VIADSYRTRTTYAVGVDPGPSTGLVVVRGDGVKLHVRQGPPAWVLDDLEARLPFLLDPAADVLVGCERYVQDATHHRSAQPVPLQVIGVVEQLARQHGWLFKLQAPADAKALAPNDLLRLVGLWTTPREVDRRDANDANDAARHALTALAIHRASLLDDLLTRFGV